MSIASDESSLSRAGVRIAADFLLRWSVAALERHQGDLLEAIVFACLAAENLRHPAEAGPQARSRVSGRRNPSLNPQGVRAPWSGPRAKGAETVQEINCALFAFEDPAPPLGPFPLSAPSNAAGA